MTTQKITPFLWYSKKAEEAAAFDAAIFPDSRTTRIAALGHARTAANGRDVRLGGGVATIQQYLRAGLADEMHLAIVPILLGSGESLFAGIDLPKLGYRRVEHVSTPSAIHVVVTK